MNLIQTLQSTLEEGYGAFTGLNVQDFLATSPTLKKSGALLFHHEHESPDINIQLLFDRDILSAWQSSQAPQDHKSLSVVFEEVSHFVYLCFNHNRGRSVTQLEMEAQSEIDRLLMAFHGPWSVPEAAEHMLDQLLNAPYPDARYEHARVIASQLVTQILGKDPSLWNKTHFQILQDFFHSDLNKKIRLSTGMCK